MRQFIDQHRQAHGVEPICTVLQIAPSGYWRYAAIECNPALLTHIERIWNANMQVYGAQKVSRQLASEGHPAARCTVKRLMRKQGRVA